MFDKWYAFVALDVALLSAQSGENERQIRKSHLRENIHTQDQSYTQAYTAHIRIYYLIRHSKLYRTGDESGVTATTCTVTTENICTAQRISILRHHATAKTAQTHAYTSKE